MRPTQGHRYRPIYIYICVQSDILCSTQIDVVDHGRRFPLAMEMEIGDDGAAGPSGLGMRRGIYILNCLS